MRYPERRFRARLFAPVRGGLLAACDRPAPPPDSAWTIADGSRVCTPSSIGVIARPLAPLDRSPASRQTRALIEQVVGFDVPVLLNGETGAGKSVTAPLIHCASPRRDGPFFTLSCAAVAAGLAESELIGHEQGAFTGTVTRKRGLLELADSGTLLLDEINSASRKVQARLLQVMQGRTLLRVGGVRPVAVDVRLIFASNQPLEPLVESGTFRQDRCFRINVFPIPLPPLRERVEDMLPLAEALLLRFARALERPLPLPENRQKPGEPRCPPPLKPNRRCTTASSISYAKRASRLSA